MPILRLQTELATNADPNIPAISRDVPNTHAALRGPHLGISRVIVPEIEHDALDNVTAVPHDVVHIRPGVFVIPGDTDNTRTVAPAINHSTLKGHKNADCGNRTVGTSALSDRTIAYHCLALRQVSDLS